ncbi:MAG: DUF420 domain-containing protein [Betaproteobacteria bacterium]
MSAPALPTLNALLNATSAVLAATGWWLIRRGRRDAHRRLMLAAFAASTLFLVGYLTYHFQVGSVRFTGQGAIRVVYFALLLSHTLLAALVLPLVLLTLSRGLRRRFEAHRRIARYTIPIWLWVSVSGVVVYWMLYRL